MIDNVIQSATKYILTKYLSDLNSGPWTFGRVCLSVKEVTRYGLPADSVVHLLMVEDPGCWTVALEVITRHGALWRFGVEGYFDDQGDLGLQGVRDHYLNWLRSL